MTLVEVLTASVLLGIGVTGLISTATLALRNQQRTDQRTIALYVAQEKLANVELVGARTWSFGHPTEGTEPREEAAYRWTIRIDPLAAGELYSVNVTVEWSGPAGSGEVALETWLNDYEAVALSTEEEREEQAPTPPGAAPKD